MRTLKTTFITKDKILPFHWGEISCWTFQYASFGAAETGWEGIEETDHRAMERLMGGNYSDFYGFYNGGGGAFTTSLNNYDRRVILNRLSGSFYVSFRIGGESGGSGSGYVDDEENGLNSGIGSLNEPVILDEVTICFNKLKTSSYSGWHADLSILANLDILNDYLGSWVGNKIAGIVGCESSWMGSDGWKNKGLPTMKITVGVISTALSGGMFGFYATSANTTTIGTTIGTIQLGINAVSTASDVSQGVFNYSLPYTSIINTANGISNGVDLANGNPIGVFGWVMWYIDYSTNK